MKQLGVLDSAFINLEHPNTPQHIGGIGIYDPSTAPGGFVRFKGVIANFEQRLMKHPMFRSRLVHAPGGLDRPYWVQDANFDVEFHIRHIALPQPGDWRQLCILVSRIHARPLDMSRPLWEAYIIEGLDNIPDVPKGAFAIYTKMHHALVDGAGGASFMSVIHDLEADPKPAEDSPGRETILVDTAPNPLYLATNSAVNQVKNSFQVAKGTLGLIKDFGKMALGIARKEIPMPPINAPKTRFNEPVGPYRVFEAAEFPLDDLKMIKNAVDAKINDVVLTVVSGAMRRYLEHYNELPEESLAAGIPLNMRTRRGVTDDNNQVGSVFMNLNTNIADPIERLKAIHQSAQEAKEFGEHSPLVDTLKIAGTFAPALTRPVVNLYVNNHLSNHMPANISTVVSNVAGPPFPLYSAGARMVRYFGMGLLTPGMGLFHLAFSSDGLLTLSILADRDTMPDPAYYRECLFAAYEELREAAIKYAKEQEEAQEKEKQKAESKPAAKAKRSSSKKAETAATKSSGKKAASAAKPAAKAKAASKPKAAAKPKAQSKAKAADKPKAASKPKPAPAPKAAVSKAKDAQAPAASGDTVTSLLAPVSDDSYTEAVAQKAAGAGGKVVSMTKKAE